MSSCSKFRTSSDCYPKKWEKLRSMHWSLVPNCRQKFPLTSGIRWLKLSYWSSLFQCDKYVIILFFMITVTNDILKWEVTIPIKSSMRMISCSTQKWEISAHVPKHWLVEFWYCCWFRIDLIECHGMRTAFCPRHRSDIGDLCCPLDWHNWHDTINMST